MKSRLIAAAIISANVTLAACSGGGSSADTPPSQDFAPQSLSALYGNVNLRYSYSTSSAVFTQTANYSASNLSISDTGTEVLVDINDSRSLGCTVLGTEEYAYFCRSEYTVNGLVNLFVFNLGTSGLGSGVFEGCQATVEAENCIADLLSTPDGLLEVAVNVSFPSAIDASYSELIVDNAVDLLMQDELASPRRIQSDFTGIENNDLEILVRALDDMRTIVNLH